MWGITGSAAMKLALSLVNYCPCDKGFVPPANGKSHHRLVISPENIDNKFDAVIISISAICFKPEVSDAFISTCGWKATLNEKPQAEIFRVREYELCGVTIIVAYRVSIVILKSIRAL